MKFEPEFIQIQDVCSQICSGGTPSTSNKAFYLDGSIPWIKTKEVNNNKIFEAENYITEDALAKSSAKLIPQNSVIIAMYGNGDTAGRVAINKIPVATNQACCNLIVDPRKADYRFVFYYLRTQYKKLVELKNGGAQQNLNSKLLKEYPFPNKPLISQIEIANFLEQIDDKILLNNQTNQTLEQMAQAIFKSWFVDFDPVKTKVNGEQPEGMDEATAALFPDKLVESELGLIPEGWEVKPLDKIAHFENGLALQNFRPESEDHDFLPVLKIAQLRQGYCDGNEKARADIKESCRVYDGDMIFSWSGSLMIDLWTGGNAALNQHLFKVTSRDYNLPLYLYWTKHHLAKFQQIAKDKAVTMGHIKRGHLSESLCVIPPKNVRDKQDELLLPLINQGLKLRLQSSQLALIRDTLLPKLLSGDIELEIIGGDGE